MDQPYRVNYLVSRYLGNTCCGHRQPTDYDRFVLRKLETGPVLAASVPRWTEDDLILHEITLDELEEILRRALLGRNANKRKLERWLTTC